LKCKLGELTPLGLKKMAQVGLNAESLSYCLNEDIGLFG
jgi:hypothetical protein